MNYSNKNNLESSGRIWKSGPVSGFSKRSLTSSPSPFLPMVARGNKTTTTSVSDISNNNNSRTNFSAGDFPQNRVPEIQMINKFYGLIPKKFVICERIRPHTVGPVRHRSTSGGSTARPKSTKDSEANANTRRGSRGGRFSRQNSCLSENDADAADAWEERNGNGNGGSGNPAAAVTTRRISFEKLYKKKPKKLAAMAHSKSVDLNYEDNSESPPVSFQRVIRIDLNQMKWEEESIADEGNASARSCEVKPEPQPQPQPKPKKIPGIRKTISFDENVLQKDDAKNELRTERPATAKLSDVETPTTPTVHWTTGKSTAERRAKLQRSFSIKDSSFDGGAESESEFPSSSSSKYPGSLVHSGRKSLHVEAAPEVDTMLSKIPNRGPKPEPEISVPKFELELSRLISESEALLLANPLDKIPKSKENPAVGSKNPESVNKIAISIPTEEISHEIPKNQKELAAIAPESNIIIPDNRIKSLTTAAERRKLLKKSTSLPNDNRGSGSGPMKLYPKKLVRQNSLGGTMGIRAGVSSRDHVTTSQTNNGVSNKTETVTTTTTVSRISIKKPLVEITRLRPKTAPTGNTNSNSGTASTSSALDRKRPQPLKARSGGHGVTTTAMATSNSGGIGSTSAKPLPQTKGTDSPKKHLSWSPSPSRVDKDMPKSASQTKSAKSPSQNGKQIISKDKEEKVPEVEVPEEVEQSADDEKSDDTTIPVSGRTSLPRRSFSLDEGALLFYSNSRELPNYTSGMVESSFQDSKKREQCVKIYEKMMKVGCGVRLQTILRGLMTPSEYRSFIAAAEKAAATAAAEKEAAEAEAELLAAAAAAAENANRNTDAGVIIVEENLGKKINSIETPIIIQTK